MLPVREDPISKTYIRDTQHTIHLTRAFLHHDRQISMKTIFANLFKVYVIIVVSCSKAKVYNGATF